MKNRYIVLAVLLFWGCGNHTVGYLMTQDAIYIPDSLVVKLVLDADEDAHRIKFGIPWQSVHIEGVQGTMPIRYRIKKIESNHGGVEFADEFSMTGKGVVELPFDHTVPVGRYEISVVIENEGHRHEIDSTLTVIVI